ncbi:phosphoacetylglucosamine mutase [Raphidocelis subcapitata]|uniref:Phosphoacetylglucosamine mutase n=1 Tax=Raphidocelis subcapitata TaxID=307507 RepID=A0A2V0NNW2_9CHLO|nr:phosphoacetylglucosamine mutase [Raphidocelis subcapitata]|eukprot:GBF88939.1 phosphoacetylglucosamine mutase [Raphidocelis subcapitata]
MPTPVPPTAAGAGAAAAAGAAGASPPAPAPAPAEQPGFDRAAVIAASKAHPKPAGFLPSYGTAGFRCGASLLDSTVFRCGLLIAARALAAGAACGVMITASHNVDTDNGVKLVDPSGEMLEPAWEELATALAQAGSDAAVADALAAVLAAHPPAAAPAAQVGPRVVLGRDTRDSGPRLAAAAAAGAAALGVAVVDVGVVTTPELHSAVVALNKYAALGEEPYFTALTESFRTLVAGTPPPGTPLFVDCANGVGGLKLAEMAAPLAALGLRLELVNRGEGRLNHDCGADYVQKEQTFPEGLRDVPEGARCCSIDGDADRVVFFTKRAGKFVLLDGDKIATLAAVFLRRLLASLPPALVSPPLRIGVVQTAYANGASTDYITRELGLEVACTATGVKHLHHVAKGFDVGIYFESNGHGTVLFDPAAVERLAALDDQVGVVHILAVGRLMNQAVGDAISGALLVEAVLRCGTTLEAWEGLYADLPSRQTKLRVANRAAIATADAERRCVAPAGLQAAIDAAVAKVPRGRAFARPSGTEDAVRVYAEAGSQAEADALAAEVGRLVYDMAGGVGPRP